MRGLREAEFTKKMKKTHTIWLPDMLHYHNALLQAAFARCGYRLEILPEYDHLAKYPLPYISNDYCYPSILILGQVLAFIRSGDCDIHHAAFMEPQTGGACRAGNIYHSMIQCLQKIGFPQVPVISLNAFGAEKHRGFSITPRLLFAAVAAVCYGDLLMTLLQQTRPYEAKEGEAKRCFGKWMDILAEDLESGRYISRAKRKERYKEIVEDFDKIPIQERKRKKVGITGEIYMKFSPIGNAHLENYLEQAGYAYRMGGFVNYAIYVVDGELEKACMQGAGRMQKKAYQAVLSYLKRIQKDLYDAVASSCICRPDALFDEMKANAVKFLNSGCCTGDGWLIAGEVIDLISQGYGHILILHPFGCLVSHVCIRGILKKLHAAFPGVTIQAVEYDYDSSKALRESRIMLGLYHDGEE